MSVMSDVIKLCLYPCKSTRKKQDFITSYFIVSLCIGMAMALALALSVLALLTSLAKPPYDDKHDDITVRAG